MAKLLIPSIIVVVWSMALVMLVGMDHFAPTALYLAFQNPELWSTLPLVIWISGLLGVGAILTVVIVGSFFGIGELAVMSVIAGVFFTYIPTMVVAYQQIAAMPIPGAIANIIAMLFVSPFIIATIITILEWWSNRN